MGEGGGELRLQPALRSGEATGRRWWGGRSRPKGGEEGRRRTRVPGLVTAGGPGIRHPDSLGEMAGGGDRRVVGTLHLLLVVAALPLAARGVSRGAAAWTQEKVRDGCCQIVPWATLAGCGDPGLGEPHRGRVGDRGRAAIPAPGSLARLGRGQESGLCVLTGVPRWPPGCHGSGVMSPASPRLRSAAGTDRRRKCVRRRPPSREVRAHRRDTAHSGPRGPRSPRCREPGCRARPHPRTPSGR